MSMTWNGREMFGAFTVPYVRRFSSAESLGLGLYGSKEVVRRESRLHRGMAVVRSCTLLWDLPGAQARAGRLDRGESWASSHCTRPACNLAKLPEVAALVHQESHPADVAFLCPLFHVRYFTLLK